MKRFFRLCARKAAGAREEIRAFWERGGVASAPDGPLPPSVMWEVSSSSSSGSSGVRDERAAEREYVEFMATRPSDEELLEWVLRAEPKEFAPPGFPGYP